MQTFVPCAAVVDCAKALDWRRLNKQITETIQILNTLTGASSGWANHPAVQMWRGHEKSLAVYGLIMIGEWRNRGYTSHVGSAEKLEAWVMSLPTTGWPEWWEREDVMRSHQSNLVRKDPDHYRPQFPDVPDDLPYVWPIRAGATA